MQRPPLVAFSHLRWDFVFQRPQHLMVRMARRRPVLFVEEPVPAEGPPRWEFSRPAPGVTVCRPLTTLTPGGFNDVQNPVIGPMVRRLLAERAESGYDLWFSSPMALPVADCLAPRVVVYDNMDDLSAFRFAPPQLLEREEQLLARADVVFTGGPSLYRAMVGRHSEVHCFSSSVDVDHFRPASPSAIRREGGPRLGFFGVLDERLDVSLLAAAADARPWWVFEMVGPVAKIDPASLPRRPNLLYPGPRAYGDLPATLADWDVALLAFARNESTRRISPTKVLEYMAGGKPIVSTRIADVAGPYGDMIGLGDEPGDFVAACDRALAEPPVDRRRRLALYEAVLSRTSWDATADAMADLIEAAATRGRPPAVIPAAAGPANPVVVIGAGPTGLSAAYHLGAEAVLVEGGPAVGGWCRSMVDRGFTFDYAGHIMFSNDPYVRGMYRLLLGDNVHWQDREAWIYSHGVHTRYPFQGALYGLPPEVIRECLMGAIEARFGSPGEAPAPADDAPRPSGPGGQAHGDGAATRPASDPKDFDASGRPSAPGDAHPPAGEPGNFEEFIYKVWGAGIAKHFAIPYNRKIWAVPLDSMETSWLGGRVPLPDLEEMIAGALAPKPRPMGPNARFGYPLRGGFQALMDGFLPHLAGELRLNARVNSISLVDRSVTLVDGTALPFEQLISTMPLPELIRALGDEVPDEVMAAAAGLRHTSVRCVNLGVGREALTDKHWIYYPGDTVFHRIFVQGNASPHCNPPGGFGLTCEITYGPLKPLPCCGEELVKLCVEDCVRVGILAEGDPILAANQVDMPYAYVVYDHARPRNVATIREWLARHGVHLAGRYGEWEYYNSDHAFLAGRKAAEAARARASAHPAGSRA